MKSQMLRDYEAAVREQAARDDELERREFAERDDDPHAANTLSRRDLHRLAALMSGSRNGTLVSYERAELIRLHEQATEDEINEALTMIEE